MKLRDNKGSITVFVLVGLLFMSSFLLLSYGSNVSKSKTAKEMFNIVSNTYSYNDGDENAYMRAYTALRKQNAQEMTSSNEGKEDTSTLELTKTFYGPINNYRIYGNSIQNGIPSPDNPVEVESVGKSANLLNIKNRTIYSGDYLTETKRILNGNQIFLGFAPTGYFKGDITDYSINFETGSVIYTSKAAYYGIGFDIEVKANTKYTFSMKEGLTIGITEYTEDGTYIKYGERTGGATSTIGTVTTTENTKWIIFTLKATEANVEYTFTNIQLEEGSTATEFVPYGKYRIPVKVSGKNLFNISKITSSSFVVNNNNGTISVRAESGSSAVAGNGNTTLKHYAPDLEVGKTYTLSANTTGSRKMIWLGKTGGWNFGESRTITENDLNSVVYWYANGDTDTTFTAIISNIQIEEGTVATDYQQFNEQKFNIFLNEPLRAIGDVADYIDFSTGKVVRNIKEKVFTGEETTWAYWAGSITEKTMGVYYSSSEELGDYGSAKFIEHVGMSSHFVNKDRALAGQNDDRLGYMFAYSNSAPPYIAFKVPFTELDDWKNFLREQKTFNRPVTILYQLVTPDNTETIDVPQLIAYEDFTTIEVLTEVAPSKIEATYDGYTFE